MRRSIRQLRRRELIEATRDVIAEFGFEKATIARISERAGFSIGYLHHHFANKDELLAETVRVLYADMRIYLAQSLPRARDPIDRLLMVLEANFGEQQFTRENAYAWTSFLARVPFNTDFARLYNVFTRRLNSNLMHALRPLLPGDRAAAAAEELATLVDGYWVRLGASPEPLTSDAVLNKAWAVSDRLLDGRISTRLAQRDAEERESRRRI